MINELKASIRDLEKDLQNHSLYGQIKTKRDLCFFMERHVFAVLDFMSLLSALKRSFMPLDMLWSPPKNRKVSRFLNEISLGEESDTALDGSYISHFELYLEAMKEIGARTYVIEEFIKKAKSYGLCKAFEELEIPTSSRSFIQDTFNLIEENTPHKIAASFCFGRERTIPLMFQAVLEKIGIRHEEAPKFYYYIERHIELDGGEHGPMAETLLEVASDQDPVKWLEAQKAAIHALKARLYFWNTIELELSQSKG